MRQAISTAPASRVIHAGQALFIGCAVAIAVLSTACASESSGSESGGAEPGGTAQPSLEPPLQPASEAATEVAALDAPPANVAVNPANGEPSPVGCLVPTQSLIADFNDYDEASGLSWFINGTDSVGVQVGTAGVEGTPAAQGVPGGDGIALGITGSDESEQGILILAFGDENGATAVDASQFSGLRFALRGRGENPNLTLEVRGALSLDRPLGECEWDPSAVTSCSPPRSALTFPESETEWVSVEIPWAGFTGGVGSLGGELVVDGSGLLALQFGVSASATTPYLLVIDDLMLY